MGPTKIMIIRHAEKPGIYGNKTYEGISPEGHKDASSLVTMGWERAGAIANLLYPTNNIFQNKALAKPDFIYASDPADKSDGQEPSQRPYQTISALAAKMKLPASSLHISFKKKDYAKHGNKCAWAFRYGPDFMAASGHFTKRPGSRLYC